MVAMQTLKSVVHVDGTPYPLYVGFVSAADLIRITDVPSFSDREGHADIARNVLNPPLKDWQRPLIEERWKAIRDRFSMPRELMPNPILLAVDKREHVEVQPLVLHGQQTPVFVFNVDRDLPSGQRPLWILDGQHRVTGMSESSQSENPIPVVILHDSNANYSPEQFARIFAEVTTQATALSPLHHEWLSYAFRLSAYEPTTGQTDSDAWKAMNATARLCEAMDFDGQTNIFHDRIQFNPEKEAQPAVFNGFKFSAIDLKDLFEKSYYKQRADDPLEPNALAAQVSISVRALKDAVTTDSTKCVFWGDPHHISILPQYAFLEGVCAYLRKNGKPPNDNWADILGRLKFGDTDWDFAPWVSTTSGSEGNASRKVISKVFEEAFESTRLWANIDSIPLYLQGSRAELFFELKQMGTGGRAVRRGLRELKYPTNGSDYLRLGDFRHLKLVSHTSNIAKIEVTNLNERRNTDFAATNLRRGVHIDSSDQQVELSIVSEFYGGRKHELELKINVGN